MDNIEDKQGYTKPSYDGRLIFYRLLSSYQVEFGRSRFINDFQGMEKSLRGFLQMVYPFIKEIEADKIKLELDKIKLFLSNKLINKYYSYIDSQLNEIMFKLYKESKHMLLPFSDEETGEINIDLFLKESDL